MGIVTIFTKTDCPRSLAARCELTESHIPFQEIVLDASEPQACPEIYFDNHPVLGGVEELMTILKKWEVVVDENGESTLVPILSSTTTSIGGTQTSPSPAVAPPQPPLPPPSQPASQFSRRSSYRPSEYAPTGGGSRSSNGIYSHSHPAEYLEQRRRARERARTPPPPQSHSNHNRDYYSSHRSLSPPRQHDFGNRYDRDSSRFPQQHSHHQQSLHGIASTHSSGFSSSRHSNRSGGQRYHHHHQQQYDNFPSSSYHEQQEFYDDHHHQYGTPSFPDDPPRYHPSSDNDYYNHHQQQQQPRYYQQQQPPSHYSNYNHRQQRPPPPSPRQQQQVTQDPYYATANTRREILPPGRQHSFEEPRQSQAQRRRSVRNYNQPRGAAGYDDERSHDNRSYDNRSYDANRSYDNRSYGNRSQDNRSYDNRSQDRSAASRENNYDQPHSPIISHPYPRAIMNCDDGAVARKDSSSRTGSNSRGYTEEAARVSRPENLEPNRRPAADATDWEEAPSNDNHERHQHKQQQSRGFNGPKQEDFPFSNNKYDHQVSPSDTQTPLQPEKEEDELDPDSMPQPTSYNSQLSDASDGRNSQSQGNNNMNDSQLSSQDYISWRRNGRSNEQGAVSAQSSPKKRQLQAQHPRYEPTNVRPVIRDISDSSHHSIGLDQVNGSSGQGSPLVDGKRKNSDCHRSQPILSSSHYENMLQRELERSFHSMDISRGAVVTRPSTSGSHHSSSSRFMALGANTSTHNSSSNKSDPLTDPLDSTAGSRQSSLHGDSHHLKRGYGSLHELMSSLRDDDLEVDDLDTDDDIDQEFGGDTDDDEKEFGGDTDIDEQEDGTVSSCDSFRDLEGSFTPTTISMPKETSKLGTMLSSEPSLSIQDMDGSESESHRVEDLIAPMPAGGSGSPEQSANSFSVEASQSMPAISMKYSSKSSSSNSLSRLRAGLKAQSGHNSISSNRNFRADAFRRAGSMKTLGNGRSQSPKFPISKGASSRKLKTNISSSSQNASSSSLTPPSSMSMELDAHSGQKDLPSSLEALRARRTTALMQRSKAKNISSRSLGSNSNHSLRSHRSSASSKATNEKKRLVELPAGNPMTVFEAMQTLKKILPRDDLKYNLTTYRNSFTGRTMATALQSHYELTAEEAEELGHKLFEKRLFHHVCYDHGYEVTSKLFFRLQCHQTPEVLNGFCIWKDDRTLTKPSSEVFGEIVIKLHTVLAAITDKKGRPHYSHALKHYEPLLEELEFALCELQMVRLARMDKKTLLACGLNVFQFFLHFAFMKVGVPASSSGLTAFWTGLKFNVGGNSYTFSDWWNGICRGNRKGPYGPAPFKGRDTRMYLSLPKPTDFRIHFAIVMTQIKKPMHFYSPDRLDEELDQVTKEVCHTQAFVEMDLESNTLFLPRSFEAYKTDFASSSKAIAKELVSYLPDQIGYHINCMTQKNKKIKVVFEECKADGWTKEAGDYLLFEKAPQADVKSLSKKKGGVAKEVKRQSSITNLVGMLKGNAQGKDQE